MDERDEKMTFEKILDFLMLFLHSLCVYCMSLVKKCKRLLRKYSQNDQIADLANTINDQFTKHPVLRYVALATGLGCAIPVLMFIAFGLVSIVITFAGFLFIEGTLLAIGGLCMFASLAMMGLFMSIMGLTFFIIYLSAHKLGLMMHKFDCSSVLKSYSSQNEINHFSSIAEVHQE